MSYILGKIFLDDVLVSKKIAAEHFQDVAVAGAFISFVQKEKAVIAAAHVLFPLYLVFVSVKMFFPLALAFLLPIPKAAEARINRNTRMSAGQQQTQ